MSTARSSEKKRIKPGTPSFRGLNPASEAASRSKRANRKTDSLHEILLRRELRKLGLRYRKHAGNLLGKPDIVFRTARVVVFCDGDFWHGRDWARLKRRLLRRHNASYWVAKIARNRKRDREVSRGLLKTGWHVVRIWESDILRDPASGPFNSGNGNAEGVASKKWARPKAGSSIGDQFPFQTN